MKYIPLLLLVALTSCTLFSRSSGGDALQDISKEVLDEDKGINIAINPIEKSKG